MDLFGLNNDSDDGWVSIAPSRKGSTKAKPNNLVVIRQRGRYTNGKLIKQLEFFLSGKLMELMRVKVNDRINIAFHPQMNKWRLKLEDTPSAGYSISKAGDKGKVRVTITESTPCLIYADDIALAQSVSNDANICCQMGEAIFSIQEIEVIENIKNESVTNSV